MTMQISETKFDSMIETAKTNFWQAVAIAIPTATTGDVSPDVYHNLERAMREALTEWVDNNATDHKVRTVEVLLHYIEYRYNCDVPTEMEIDDSSIEHIAYCISQGISEGELFTAVPEDEHNNTYAGWWNIKY